MTGPEGRADRTMLSDRTMLANASFAIFLAGLLAARFSWWLKYSPPESAADIRLFSRRLSRTVYLVLYLIIGAKQIVNIIGGFEDGAAIGQDPGMLVPAGQVFLVHGLIALVLIRVLAYLTWRRYRTPSLLRRGPLRARQPTGDAGAINSPR
jgi:cytochrome b561